MPWGRNRDHRKGRGGPAPTGIPPADDRTETPSITILAHQAVEAENGAREVAVRLEDLIALADTLTATGAEIRRRADGLAREFERLDARVGGRP